MTEPSGALQVLFLAAGFGSRLEKHTEVRPKCLLPLGEKPLLSYLLDTFLDFSPDEIFVASGYKSTQIKDFCREFERVHVLDTHQWKTRGPVATLHEAFSHLLPHPKDTIISYTDIFFQKSVVQDLLKLRDHHSLILPSFEKWRSLWELRFGEPLRDLETFRINENFLQTIGDQPQTMAEIQGQFMGIFFIAKDHLQSIFDLLSFYLAKIDPYGHSTTAFINWTISSHSLKWRVLPSDGPWFEFDQVSDLELFLSEQFKAKHMIKMEIGK